MINAIRPGLVTVPGSILLAASSPHARRGALWEAHRRHYGRDGDPILVWQAPCELLKSFRLTEVVGDRWAAGFAAEAFKQHGLRYTPSVKTKSDLYLELLPLLNSGRVVLPRSDRLVQQLVGLERRTARGGRDSIDHAPGGHDDLANAVAGACAAASKGNYDTYVKMDWVMGPDLASAAADTARADFGSDF